MRSYFNILISRLDRNNPLNPAEELNAFCGFYLCTKLKYFPKN